MVFNHDPGNPVLSTFIFHDVFACWKFKRFESLAERKFDTCVEREAVCCSGDMQAQSQSDVPQFKSISATFRGMTLAKWHALSDS